MVVGDDDIHPQTPGVGGLLQGGDAAVHGDDEGDPLGVEGIHRLPVEAVALLQAVGDVRDHPGPPFPEELGEQTGGGDAVYIIVSIDGDMFLLGDGPLQPGGRPVHVPHQEGVVEGGVAIGEKGPGRPWLGEPPGAEHQSGQHRQAGPRQGGDGGPVRRGQVPFLIFHGMSSESQKITLYYSKSEER